MPTADEISKIKAAIQKTGFPAELTICAKLLSLGIKPYQSQYYIDKDENKAREIDIVAGCGWNFTLGATTLYLIRALVIEVKKSTRPWVIFTSARSNTDHESPSCISFLNVDESAASDITSIVHATCLSQFERIGRNGCVLYAKELSNGSIEDGDRNGERSSSIPGLLPSIKASINISAYNKIRLDHYGTEAPSQATKMAGIVERILVLDGKLFESYLDEHGNLQVNETHHIPYLVNYDSENYPHLNLIVHIVTISHFVEFVRTRQDWVKSVGISCANIILRPDLVPPFSE